jgi:Domain of unknown function (DUF1996)
MRKLLALGVALVSLPAIVLAAGASAQTGLLPTNGQTGLFNTPCKYSHRAPDDPIVYPGRPRLSHEHDFLGNTSTNASSTLETLKAGGSLCRRAADRSAYWVPTLYENGRELAPHSVSIYYRTAGRQPGTIESFPQGLKLIAGDARATAPQEESVVRWNCAANDDVHPGDPLPGYLARRKHHVERLTALARKLGSRRRKLRRARRQGNGPLARRQKRLLRRLRAKRNELRAHPVFDGGLALCPGGQVLHLAIRFPDCWDGTSIDSADHKSHLTPAARLKGAQYRTCPPSHPRPVPQITLNLTYATRGGPGVTLASGPGYTAHADFFNAWDPAGLSDLIGRCLNADMDCGSK